MDPEGSDPPQQLSRRPGAAWQQRRAPWSKARQPAWSAAPIPLCIAGPGPNGAEAVSQRSPARRGTRAVAGPTPWQFGNAIFLELAIQRGFADSQRRGHHEFDTASAPFGP